MLTDKINKYIKQLPKGRQEEVLDFVEFLLKKPEKISDRQEEQEWSEMSLTSAMRGMEEDTPEYTTKDIKEPFS